jgi:fluoride ion exporter CrcB/FEX
LFDLPLLLGVAVAGGLASVFRLVLSKWHGYLPWGILLANSVASFALAFWFDSQGNWQVIAAAGICGGLSTFSSVVAASGEYLRGKQWTRALIYTSVSFALPFTAFLLGGIVGAQLLN